MDKLLEKAFGKTPGLDVVVIVLTTFMLPLVLSKQTTSGWDLLTVPVVWFGALILSRFRGKWDGWLFDPLYGSKGEQEKARSAASRILRRLLFPVTFWVDRSMSTKDLNNRREAAEEKFNHPSASRGKDGIYQASRTVFHGTELWEKEVQPFLEFSKAARVFVWPLIVALGWVGTHELAGWPPYISISTQGRFTASFIGLSQSWLFLFLCLQLTAGLYLFLRIIHMTKLYQLVDAATIFPFELTQSGGGGKVWPMLRVGSRVVPVDALSIFESQQQT